MDIPPLLSVRSSSLSSTHIDNTGLDSVTRCIHCIIEGAMNLKADGKLYQVHLFIIHYPPLSLKQFIAGIEVYTNWAKLSGETSSCYLPRRFAIASLGLQFSKNPKGCERE